MSGVGGASTASSNRSHCGKDDGIPKYQSVIKHGYGHSFGQKMITSAGTTSTDDNNTKIGVSSTEIDWSSTIPSSDPSGVSTLPSDEVFSEISRRVRRVCHYLCLIPSQGVFARSHREWLHCANSIVASCLNLDSPNPIGWDDITGNSGGGSKDEDNPFIGVCHKLRGPQPWQATRTYIAEKIYELLEAEGLATWVTSEERWNALFQSLQSKVEKYLIAWRSSLSQDHKSELLQQYSREVWIRFKKDHLEMLQGPAAADVPLHALTERYVHLVAKKLEKSLPRVPHGRTETKRDAEEGYTLNASRAQLLKTLEKLRYDCFPLLQGGEDSLREVCETILERLLFTSSSEQSPNTLEQVSTVASSTKKTASVLNDLEHDNAYLTNLNGLLRVRLRASMLGHPVRNDNSSTDASIESSLASIEPTARAKTPETSITEQSSDIDDRILSKTKEANSRVYAAAFNDDWYWGTICSRDRKKNLKKPSDEVGPSEDLNNDNDYLYTVIFEDGDIKEGLTSKQIITEEEYANAFQKMPPSPLLSRRKPKRARVAEGEKKPSKPPTVKTPKAASDKEHTKQSDIGSVLENSTVLAIHRLGGDSCKECILCVLPDCGRCFECQIKKQNLHEKSTHCCLRKMCCKIPTELKALHAVGFPDKNWKFVFDNPQKTRHLRSTSGVFNLSGLKIISPDGQQFLSLETAFAHVAHANISEATTLVERFLNHVGSSRYVSYPRHFLVDKDFCIDFLTSKGQTMTLYGVIVGCMRDEEMQKNEGSVVFIVQYSKEILNAAKTMGLEIHPMQLISASTAWGGAIAYERKTNCTRKAILKIDQATPCETWITPDVRLEELVDQPDGTSLPQLTLFVRGYKFVLKTMMPSQSYGVFVSCTPLRDIPLDDEDEEEINFKPGELVDLGVFSHQDDETPLPAFIVKNYIHSFKCGRWAFLCNESNSVFDITTNSSAELQEIASKQVHPYIRKSEREEFPMIHARVDPLGKIHYLFGIPYRGCWDEYEAGMNAFTPLFGGEELEATVSCWFGLHSRRHGEMNVMGIIKSFQTEDILACTDYLNILFPDDRTVQSCSSDIISLSSKVICFLKERASEIAGLFDKSRQETNYFRDATEGEKAAADALESLEHIAKLLKAEK